ncbi:MAG TPA: peptide MFS transporter [bacterium]|nr:peptide MFS transporter [bacterium]HPN45026.1 peptide MFS transporter [bacterium]
MFKNHPRGLVVLFFTEMWERFGYYLLLGIFTLYMIDTQAGGLGLSLASAADIYGTYLALVYLAPFVGGLLADRILGYRRAIIIGGLLMGTGYITLALPGMTAFWIALFLIIIGNGFFKPNISTLVGNLYTDDKYKPLKDTGYNIFYMGINIGSFICNFVAAYLRNHYGWGYAFAAAGIGLYIGVIIFIFGKKHVALADVRKPVQKEDMSLGKIGAVVFLPALLVGAIGWFLPGNLFGSDSTDAFLFSSIPIVLFYLSLWLRASKEDKAPIGALLAIFAVVVVFWGIFHQNGSALTIWAESYTHRELPAAVQPAAQAFGMVQEVDTTPREVPRLDVYGKPVIDADNHVVTTMGPHPYFNNLDKAQWPVEGKSLKLISTEIFQSVNPFFVVALTPLVVVFFGFLRKKGKEPSTPVKIGSGLFITAISTLVMIAAVFASQNGLTKCSPWWLISSYALITVGELFLSPMGLSLVSKLSPPRITALMMGGWFLATSIGNKLSGILSSLWEQYDHKAIFFSINFAGALLATLAILVMLKWLKKVVKEHTEGH